MRRFTVPLLGAVTALSFAVAACAGGGIPTAPAAPTTPATGAGTGQAATPAATPAVNYPPPLRPDQQVTIRFESYNLFSAGLLRDATLKLIDNFEKKHPNIKVETKATRDQEIFPSVQAQVVAGNPPDIVQILLREMDLNVDNLPVVPLERIVSPEEFAAHIRGEHPYHPRAVALTQRNGLTYGLSYVFSTPTLFYNATLMREAGLNPDNPPRTWDQVAAQARQIAERTGKGGLYIACIELDWCTQGLLLSNGGRVMNPERTQITWAQPNALEVVRQWQRWVNDGAHVKLSGADASAAFQAGNLGFFLQTSAVQSGLINASRDRWELRSAAMPQFGDRPAVPVNSGAGLAIFATDPAKQRAAWEFMKYFTSEEAFMILVTEMGYLPLRAGMMDDPKYLLNWPNRRLIEPNIAQLDRLEPSLSFPGQNHLQIRDLFLKSLQEALLQNANVDQVMTTSANRAQDLMPRR